MTEIEKAATEFGKINVESWGEQLDSIYKMRDFVSEWFREAIAVGSPEYKSDVEMAISQATELWEEKFLREILGLGVPEKILTPEEARDHGEKYRNTNMAFAIGMFIINIVAEVVSIGQVDTVFRFYDMVDRSTGLGQISAEMLRAQLFPGVIQPLRHYWNAQYPTDIPGPGDLIRFAVREAYDETRWTELPPGFSEYMKFQGYSETWSNIFWTAHWQLPSLTACYEAVWRGKRSEDWLKDMLTLHDFEAQYHDVLIANMYKTLPRVDIRRAYEAGFFDESEVENRMKIEGYNEEDAAIQAATQIREVLDVYIKAEAKESETDFIDGFIDEATLRANLEALIPNPDIVEYRITRAVMRKQREFLKDLVKITEDEHYKNMISDEDLENVLRYAFTDENEIALRLERAYVRKFKKAK